MGWNVFQNCEWFNPKSDAYVKTLVIGEFQSDSANCLIFMNGNDLKFIFINSDHTQHYQLDEFSVSDIRWSFEQESGLYDANSFTDLNRFGWKNRKQMDKSDIMRDFDIGVQTYSDWRSKSSLS